MEPSPPKTVACDAAHSQARTAAHAVFCRTCTVVVWEGDAAPEQDEQALLTAYAESTPGTACPSKVDRCPHKIAAVADRDSTGAPRAPTLTRWISG